MSPHEPTWRVVGAERRPAGTGSGWDFWWGSSARDVAVVFHGFGGGGSGLDLATWVRGAMAEPVADSLEARARWPVAAAQALALERLQPPGVAGGSMASVAMGTDRLAIAHVGDARVFRMGPRGLELLTRDHSLAEYAVPELAHLRDQLSQFDASRFLLRSVGAAERFDIDVSTHAMGSGDTFALCTASVHRALDDVLGDLLARGPDAPVAIVDELAKRAPEVPAAVAVFVRGAGIAPAATPDVRGPSRSRGGDASDLPFLVITRARDPRHEGRRYPLAAAVTTIGRGTDCDVVLEDAASSRRHARVERRLDGFWLVDHSANGTYVDGQPLQGARRLARGARLRIGETSLAFGHTTLDVAIEEGLHGSSPRDGLTGLNSRHRLLELTARALSHARRAQQAVALVRFDIAGFKRLNDEHGVAIGDEVLRALAGLLQEHARAGHELARLPGDELAWLLPDTDRDAAAALAETVRAAAAAHQLVAGDVRIDGVELWVGVAQATDETQTSDDLLREADPVLRRLGLTGL